MTYTKISVRIYVEVSGAWKIWRKKTNSIMIILKDISDRLKEVEVVLCNIDLAVSDIAFDVEEILECK